MAQRVWITWNTSPVTARTDTRVLTANGSSIGVLRIRAWTAPRANKHRMCTSVCALLAGRVKCAMWKWCPAKTLLFVKVSLSHSSRLICYSFSYREGSWRKNVKIDTPHQSIIITVKLLSNDSPYDFTAFRIFLPGAFIQITFYVFHRSYNVFPIF